RGGFSGSFKTSLRTARWERLSVHQSNHRNRALRFLRTRTGKQCSRKSRPSCTPTGGLTDPAVSSAYLLNARCRSLPNAVSQQPHNVELKENERRRPVVLRNRLHPGELCARCGAAVPAADSSRSRDRSTTRRTD